MIRDPFWSLLARRVVRSVVRSQRGTVVPNIAVNIALVVAYLASGHRVL